MHTGAGGAETELARRNAHAASALVSEAASPPATGDHVDVHILVGPVVENGDYPPPVHGRNEQAPQSPVGTP